MESLQCPIYEGFQNLNHSKYICQKWHYSAVIILPTYADEKFDKSLLVVSSPIHVTAISYIIQRHGNNHFHHNQHYCGCETTVKRGWAAANFSDDTFVNKK